MLTAINGALSSATLMFIALTLGMRHGLDLDHLAIIDAITRRISPNHKLSRFVGFLFSLGHGVVVIIFSVLINIFVKELSLPIWLNNLMLIVSIAFLIVFGSINIFSLFKPNNRLNIKLIFLEKFFSKLSFLKIENPFNIVLIGGIFAISFDTVSQVALFSLNTALFLKVFFPIVLGATFMLGMMITDGINGYIVSFFIDQSKKISFTLARILTLCIGLFSTGLGIIEITHLI